MDKNYFSYAPEDGFHLHETLDAAVDGAEANLEMCRDVCASDGWPEDTGEIYYGQVLGKATKFNEKIRPPESELDEDGYDEDGTNWSEWSEICDYRMEDSGITQTQDMLMEAAMYIHTPRERILIEELFNREGTKVSSIHDIADRITLQYEEKGSILYKLDGEDFVRFTMPSELQRGRITTISFKSQALWDQDATS